MENALRELLQGLADEMPPHRIVPHDLRPRVRQRVAFSVMTAVAVVAVAVAAFLGVRSLSRSDTPVPAHTVVPKLTAVAKLSDAVVFALGGNRDARPVGAVQVALRMPDGSLQPLTRTRNASNEPEGWSPDGSSVVVQRDMAGRGVDLFVVHLDGSPDTRLTSGSGWDGAALFSPDGSKVAFVSGNDSGSPSLDVVGADGAHRRQLAGRFGSPIGTAFSWSPDATRIAFSWQANQSSPSYEDIYAVGLDGAVTRLTDPSRIRCFLSGIQRPCVMDEDPVWSPDGSTIAFLRITESPPGSGGPTRAALYTMRADGSGEREIGGPGSPNLCSEATLCTSPAWSPDGSELAVSGVDGVFVVRPDPTGNEVFHRVAPPGWSGVSWSPDGRWIGVQHRDRVYAVHPDGSGLAPVTDGSQREWGVPMWRP